MPHQRLLVIDDERVDRAIVYHAATRAGLVATAVGSVDEARELLEHGARFGFVVLDLSLGDDDGLRFLHALAQFNNKAVVVFASGFDQRVLAASQRVALSLGLLVGGVLRKPILPANLLELLNHTPRTSEPGNHVNALIPPEQLRAAIADGQLRPWFQPKVSLSDGAIIGCEALARWVQSDGRLVSPGEFIPVAEQSGLVAALTDTVLDHALRACARWRRVSPACSVAVNISPLLLSDPRLPDRIEARLQAHGVPPGALVLEITEGNGIPDTPCAMEILTRLRIRGVSLSVDDFGTGHSSLLSLVRMPFNELKIDQAFVREAAISVESRKVVRASASLARELGLRVVAEGVETEAIAALVRDAGCHVGQGWLYGRAVPSEMFEAQLAAAQEITSAVR
jgi:EAL domain-containing protein (putative c-di-GMP-specific phosphodiesterase class I)